MSVPAPGDDRVWGVVSEFDEHIGLGRVTADAGAGYPFHCTQIAGGGRSIPVGEAVSFVVIAGRGGTWEAADIRPVGPPG
jgi:cold shock CspA family protein